MRKQINGRNIVINMINVVVERKDSFPSPQALLKVLESQIPQQQTRKPKFKEVTDQKYCDRSEIKAILNHINSLKQNTWTNIWTTFFIHTAINTGLRVAEIADLRCSDGYWKNKSFRINVRHGKGDKQGKIICTKGFQKQWDKFIKQKQNYSQLTGDDDFLFYSRRTHKALTIRAFQKALKKILKQSGVLDKYTPHSIRHSYGTFFSTVSKIRHTQVQLRHANIETTQIYVGVIEEDIEKAAVKYRKLIYGKKE